MPDETQQLLNRLLHEVVDGRRDIDARFDRVEKRIDSFRSEMLGHFDEIYRRLDRLESEYNAIAAAITRLEQRLSQTPTREEVQAEIRSLKERLADLEERLARLEADADLQHDA